MIEGGSEHGGGRVALAEVRGRGPEGQGCTEHKEGVEDVGAVECHRSPCYFPVKIRTCK